MNKSGLTASVTNLTSQEGRMDLESNLRKSGSLQNLNKIGSNKLGKKSLMRSSSSLNLVLRNPPIEFIGSRVVRGPDWKWGKQDGKRVFIRFVFFPFLSRLRLVLISRRRGTCGHSEKLRIIRRSRSCVGQRYGC